MKKFADTPTKRFLKLSKLTLKTAGKYGGTKLKHQVSKNKNNQQDELSALFEDIGDQVFQTLGEMKGAAMKVGQIASQMRHFFPDEFAQKLESLQKNSPPMPYEVISRQIHSTCGFYPEQLFKHFDTTPFAAASIGQVHRATTHQGIEVIVKVQYPGVRTSCASDLAQLKTLFSLSGLLKVDKASLNEAFEEIKTNLMAELDYEQEAKNLKDFYVLHQNNPNIVIPEVLEDFSNDVVLTLKYEEGLSLNELLESNAALGLKNTLAENLIDAILFEITTLGRAHADPHPGNFAFRKNGQVVIYDYGSVAPVSERVIDSYITIVKEALAGDFSRIDEHLLALGARNPAEQGPSLDVYAHWFNTLLAPAFNEPETDKAIAQIQHAVQTQMRDFMQYRGVFKPCAETLFINRIIAGHFLNLAQMDASPDLAPLALKYFGEYLGK